MCLTDLKRRLNNFTQFSQNYHTVFTKARYNIDNETRGNTSKTIRQPKGQEDKQMAKVFYSVELESNSYMDDIINGTLEECREWCKEHRYTNADGRIAEITDDGDPLVTAFYEIED